MTELIKKQVLAAEDTASLEVKIVIAIGSLRLPSQRSSSANFEMDINTHLMLTRAMCHLIMIGITS
jgi:hypothetical protein